MDERVRSGEKITLEYAAAKQMDMTIKELETARKFYLNAYRATRQRVENRRVEQTWDVAEESQTEKNTTAVGDVSYSFKESFGTQLEDWRKGNGKAYGSYNGKFFELGTTPDILVRHGAPEGEVIMFEDCLAKIAGLKHSISLDEIAKIPAQLNDPILLFKGSHENSFVVLTEVKAKNGHDVIVAIHINKKLGRSVINKIVSVYSKIDDYGNNKIKNYVMAQISAGNLLDASTKKAPTWFTASGLQLPHAVQTIIDANNSISQTTENSQQKFSSIENADLSLKDEVEVSPKRTKELLDTIAYLKGQFETTKFAKADPQKLRSMTRKLLKEYSSNLDLGETTTAMDELYRYMANGEDGILR